MARPRCTRDERGRFTRHWFIDACNDYLCRRCGLRLINTRIVMEMLKKMYPAQPAADRALLNRSRLLFSLAKMAD